MSEISWSAILDAMVSGTKIEGKRPGSPANETLSVPDIKSWEKGCIDAQWSVRKELTNSRGELFGGYYGVLADVTLSYTAMTLVADDERFKTTDLRVSYFRPIFDGVIKIEGRVINRSRSFLHAEAMFYREEDGKLLAKAGATFAVVPA